MPEIVTRVGDVACLFDDPPPRSAGHAAAEAGPGGRVTIVQSFEPPIVAKSFFVKNNKIEKYAVAHVTVGKAWSKPVSTADEMVALLGTMTSRRDCCLLPCTFKGDKPDTTIAIMSQKKLARALGCSEDSPKLAGIHEINGRRTAARLKISTMPSAWVLLDADDPPGMPEALKTLDLGQRIAEFDKILPGLARAERIEYRSSSSRVRHRDEPPRRRAHAWVRISRPDKLEWLRLHLDVAAALAGLSFPSPRYDRQTGEIIGYSTRTLLDTSVMITGRLVFVAEPRIEESAKAAGHVLDDPDITIVNEGGGVVDVSSIRLPDVETLDRVAKATGQKLFLDRRGSRLSMIDESSLTPGLTIERRGTRRTLQKWLDGMEVGRKLRCETPFRESSSEAAFIRKHADGSATLHDVGTGTTYVWHGPNRRVVGMPGERVVVAADEEQLAFAMLAADCSYGILFNAYSNLEAAYFPATIKEAIVAWPKVHSEGLRQQFIDRLRAARMRVVVTEAPGALPNQMSVEEHLRRAKPAEEMTPEEFHGLFGKKESAGAGVPPPTLESGQPPPQMEIEHGFTPTR